jgi:hypothetical protein
LRLLVCGGRDFNDRSAVFTILDRVHSKRPITCVIHGAARGADSLAGEWARSRGIQEWAFPADWAKHGRQAGPIRNEDMLRTNPDGVLAFPGGAGTAHMVLIAKRAGVTVWEPMRLRSL